MIRKLLALLATTFIVFQAVNSHAYEGRLLDVETGMPMQNVWVVGHWETGGGFVISSGGCAIAITRTNAKGEFTLIGRGGLIGNPFGIRSRPVIYLYKRGYRQRIPSPDQDFSPFYMEKDNAPTLARLDRLLLILGQTDCGESSNTDHKKELSPLFSEINEESKAIAQTPLEKKMRGSIQWHVDLLEVGYEEAVIRARAEPSNLIVLPTKEIYK